MNNTQNLTTSTSSYSESSISDTKYDSTATDQGAVTYLQIVCLLVFSVQLVFFLIILKKYIIKFMAFFIVRKDYQNLHILDVSDQIGLDNGINSFGSRHLGTDSCSLNGKSKLRLCYHRFSRKFIQNTHTYHPIAALTLATCNKTTAIKLPRHVALWILLASLLLTMSLTIIVAQLVQSKCLDKRFYAASAYGCQQDTPSLLSTPEILIASIFISITCIGISLLGIFKFTKNYLSFLRKFAEFNNRNKSSEEIDSSPMYNKQTELKQHMPTQQNMLEDGSDYTRRSVRGGALPPINEFSAYKAKGLFQINEADNDEECNSQRSSSEQGKSFKKDDRTSMITKTNGKQTGHKTQRAMDDPFNNSGHMEHMNDSHNNYSQKLHVLDQQLTQGSAQKNKLLDSTTLDGKRNGKLSSPESKTIQTRQDKLDLEQSPNKDLKKMEDTQRISMVPQKVSENQLLMGSSSQNKHKRKYQIIKAVFIIIILILFVLGILLDAYAFFNMTYNGLIQVLKIFGLALVADYFILRIIGILLISMISTLRDIKANINPSFDYYDSNQLDALGQIYKGYHQNINQYIPIALNDQANGPSSECDSDEQLLGKKSRQHNSNSYDPSTFGGLRFIKLIGALDSNRNRAAPEILLVEPTYLNKRHGGNRVPHEWNMSSQEDSNNWHHNKRNNIGEVLQVTTLNFNNNSNGGNQRVNYGPNEDILNSSNNEPETKTHLQNKGLFNRGDVNEQNDDTFEIGKGFSNSNGSQVLPSIFGKRGLQDINMAEVERNQSKHKQNNSSILYPGQSISYNNQFGVDSQGSPLQDQDYNNMSDASHMSKLKQDQMYPTAHFDYMNGPHNKNGCSDDQQLYGGGDLTSNKRKMFGKIVLPNGFALFNLPLFNGIWGKNNKGSLNENAIWDNASKRRTLGQLVNGGDMQYYNFPAVVDEAENKLNMILTPENNLFRSVKKNSKGEIQIIDSTSYHNLPFMKFNQQQRDQHGPIISNSSSSKNKLGEEVIIKSSQKFNGVTRKGEANQGLGTSTYDLEDQNEKKNNQKRDIVEIDTTLLISLPMFKEHAKLSPEEASAKEQILKLIGKRNIPSGQILEINSTKFYDMSMFNGKAELTQEMKNLQNQLNSTIKNKPLRDIVEIDSTVLISLPLFQKDAKLTSDEANGKKLLLDLIGKKKLTKGEIIQINATQFYNLPMFNGKTAQSPEMQNLQSQLNQAITNKSSREVVEIDSTYLYSLPMFQNNENLTKEAVQFKTQFLSLIGNKRLAPGEIIQVDSTQFYDLPIFSGSSAILSPELKQLQNQIKQSVKKRPSPGEIVQIDSTMLANLSMFAEGANLSPEAQEIKRQLFAAMGTKKLNNGEIIQIDSSQLFNLSLFQQEGKAKLSPELQELTRQLLSAMKRKTSSGEVLGIDSTYIIDLSNNLHLITKQTQRQQDEEEGKEYQEQKSLHSVKKRKTNRALIQGVSSQIMYDASNDQTLKITPLDKMNTQIDSQAELNELIHDGKGDKTMLEESKDAPKINTSFYLPPINNVRSQMFETPDSQAKGFNRNVFEGDQLNVTQNLEEIIEYQEIKKRDPNSSLKKYDSDNQENANASNVPLKMNASINIVDEQDQNINGTKEEGEADETFSPQYNSHNKEKKQNELITKKKARPYIFEDQNNENDNSLSNHKQSKSPLNINQKPADNYLDQSFKNLSNTKEKMNLENFIKPNIPKMRKQKVKQPKEQVQLPQDDTLTSNKEDLFKAIDQSIILANDTNRSRVYEDSDNSTFRMISFSKNKQTQEQVKASNFYSLNSPEPDNIVKEQKVFELPEDTQFDKKRSSKNKRRGQVQILDSDQDDLDILGDMMKGQVASSTLDNFDSAENDINDMKFSKRKQIKINKKRQESNRSSSSKESKSQRSYTNENPQLSMNEQLRQKQEKKAKIQERLNEQKRKLHHFLKLAQQMKSISDENKINELLEVLNTTKKPLPMSKINELKMLEMMSSPYNQSLTAMIKDEVQFYKKKKGDGSKNARSSGKSQQRNDQNHQDKLNKLGGIYGSKGKIEQQRVRKNSSESSIGGDASEGIKNRKTILGDQSQAIKGARRQLREKSQNRNISFNNQIEAKNMSSLAFNSSDDDFIAKPHVRPPQQQQQQQDSDNNSMQDLI